MKRIAILALLIILVACIVVVCMFQRDKLVLQSMSPNSKYEIKIYERSDKYQGNFYIIFIDNTTDRKERIFNSPDEGEKKNLEVVWNRASTLVALVGEGFMLCEDNIVLNGDRKTVYVIYDIVDGATYCDSGLKYDADGKIMSYLPIPQKLLEEFDFDRVSTGADSGKSGDVLHEQDNDVSPNQNKPDQPDEDE